MFVVEIGAVITTVAWLIQLFGGAARRRRRARVVHVTVAIWLWLTVIFANLAEALAEGRGKAQADALRAMRTETTATLRDGGSAPASELRRGDVVVVEAGEVIPGDGTVDRGHRLGRRVGDHRRVGAGDPRVRRRPQRGHRRHARALATGSWSRSRRSPGSRSWTA